jgi:DNA-binding NarL/FixJ family response regulator
MKSFQILIVEDNMIFRQTMADFLSSGFPSATIEEAGDGQEAWQKIDTHPPDLIFMDIRLPRQNGLQLTGQIKKTHPGIIVVMLTSYDQPEYREEARRVGADHFLVKGTSTNEDMTALVREILEKSSKPIPSQR